MNTRVRSPFSNRLLRVVSGGRLVPAQLWNWLVVKVNSPTVLVTFTRMLNQRGDEMDADLHQYFCPVTAAFGTF